MAKISTYVIDGTIVDGDKVIGSDANNDMITKNYTIGDLVNYFAFQIGSNYLVPYLNANNNVDLGSYNLTANDLIATNQVIIGGTAGLSGQVLTSQGPGSPAIWAYNAGSQDLQGVLGYGNTANLSIFLDNPTGSALLDIDKVYGDASIILDDKTNSNTSRWYPNLFHLEDNSIGRELNIYSNEIEFYNGTNTVSFKPTSYSNQNFLLPNVGGAFVMSVNGVYADMSGAITLPTGTGTVSSVGATAGTGVSVSVSNPTTTPNITITNTAPDQVVSLTAGSGIGVTGSYPNFTITNTSAGSGTVTSIATSAPITGGTITTSGTIGITQATGSSDGYLSSSDWTLFNSKQGQLTLTTTGTSGAATLIGNTLNIPQYQAAGTYVSSVGATGPITSSGGTTPTISTSMNTNKLIGRSTAGAGVMEEITIGSGLSLSSGTLSANVSGTIPKGTASGTDTYTTTISGVSSYVDGDAYLIRFTNGNTTGSTLNINGLGARTLYRNNDGALIGGDIISGGEMICVYNSTLVGFQVIGTAPNTLLGYVTNNDSVTITKGQVVYAFGGQGDRMTVKLASNTTDATSARTVGVVLSTSIAANQKGLIMMQGLLDGLSILPTATYSDGDPIYLGATAGSITNVKPYAPSHLVYVATVTTASNGAAGRMYVNIQNGYELDELHNVQAQSPALKDTLWYDSTVSPGQWKTASISTILGYTPLSAAITSLGGLTGATQTFATGTTGTNFAISSAGTTHTFNLPTASATNRGALSSADWSLFSNNWLLKSYQDLGSTFKSYPLTMPQGIAGITTNSGLTDSSARFVIVYIPLGATITGVKWYQTTQGVYTADAYNGVGLYTYSAGTLTLVASSTNDGDIWKAASNTWATKAFSSTYVATAGTYVIGALYNSSAQTTAPALGAAASTSNNAVMSNDFTNSAKISSSLGAQTSLPASTAMSSLTVNNTNLVFWLY